MKTTSNWFLRSAAAIGGTLMILSLTACQQGEATFAANRKTQAIPQLEAAMELDYSRANSNIDPVSRDDYYAQGESADRTIKQLQFGADVPQQKIDDALVVPNEPRSPEATASLINKLQEARKMDDQGNRDYLVDPVFAQDFDVQGREARSVAYDLQAGQNVPRPEIKEALEVPPNP
jgi:hypothetical protein